MQLSTCSCSTASFLSSLKVNLERRIASGWLTTRCTNSSWMDASTKSRPEKKNDKKIIHSSVNISLRKIWFIHFVLLAFKVRTTEYKIEHYFVEDKNKQYIRKSSMFSQIDFKTFHTPAAMQFSPLLNIQAIIPWLKRKTNKQTSQ